MMLNVLLFGLILDPDIPEPYHIAMSKEADMP